ncbi:MAG: GtrA family protein [Lachnospiraceae bacterium]|nr:GtrA family protein [Lachnospiraceae bacterium]
MSKLLDSVKKVVDITLLKFIIVGVINTIVGTAIMFTAYNVLHFNYWVSSALNYILASILSYFLNKYITFQNKNKSIKIVLKFILNITICYLLAYGIAKPLVGWLLADAGQAVQDNGAMLAGMCFFVGFNYLGQRFFAFKE